MILALLPVRAAAACALLSLPLAAAGPRSLDDGAAQADEIPGGAAVVNEVVSGDVGRALQRYLGALERFGLHGTILVANGEEILLAEGYGIADLESGRRNTVETAFDLGSLGKQFTATAVLTLAAEGRVDVDAPISTYLDGVPDDKAAVTVHHLLTHTSGLPYMPSPAGHRSLPLQSAPGERYSYSNPGYSLLAEIVESVTGEGFEEWVTRTLFEAHDLRGTAYRGRPREGDDCATAYTDGTAQGSACDPGGGLPGAFRGAGGVVSTVGDLWKWEAALREGRVLPEAWTERLFTEHVRNPGSPSGYAYGWSTRDTPRGTRVAYHGGNLGGFNTHYGRYLDEGWTLIFLSNHFVNGRSMRDAVIGPVATILAGDEPAGAPATLDLPEEWLARFAGEYALEGGGRVVVEADGRDLEATGTSAAALALVFSPWLDAAELEALGASDERGEQLLEAVYREDRGRVQALLSPSLPFEPTWGALRASSSQAVARYGAFAGVESLGTALAGSPGSGKTTVRIDFENGTQHTSITWAGGRAIHLNAVQGRPSLRLAPVSELDFVAYDLFTGRTTRLSFDEEARGLVVHTAEGPRRLERAGPAPEER